MQRRSTPVSWIILGVCLLSAFASVSVAQDLPIPRPTGEFGVGTTVWHWVDSQRPDDVTADPSDVREIMAQVWYPTDTPAATYSDIYAPLDKGVTQAKGWSRPARPFAAAIEKAPVIALCPGLGLARQYYTSLAEDLASHGYVVLGMDFPHYNPIIYPDGRFIAPSLFPPLALWAGGYDGVDRFHERSGALGTGDTLFALETLEKLTKSDPTGRLTDKLDWKRLGAFGHSQGGRSCAGAVQATNEKFLAFAAMEGAAPRQVRLEGMKVPVMMMVGSFLPDYVVNTIRGVIPNRKNDVYFFLLNTFNHNSLNDLPYLDPVRFPSAVNPAFALEQGRFMVRTFFDQYVKGTGADTRDLGQLPLVTMEYYPRPEL
jgi:dienelactone hydrolase